MTRIELLNLSRERFKQAGRSVDAYLGVAECCDELALYEPNATAVRTLAAGALACTRALSLDPESLAARTRLASLILRQAERLSGKHSQKRWQRASGQISHVLATRPDFPSALNVSGNLEQYAVDHRYPDSSDSAAVEKYKTAVTHRPDHHFALTDWARLLVSQAREIPAIVAEPILRDAETRCQEALAIRPQSYIALSVLGDILYRRADSPGASDRSAVLDQAMARYNRALQLRSDWLPALTGLATALQRKALTVSVGDAKNLREQALSKCRDALALRDDIPAALITAAHILLDFSDDNRLAEAQVFADSAAAAAPDDPEALRARARVHFARAKRAPFADRPKLLDLAAADYATANSRGRRSARTKTNIANLTIARAHMADDLDALPMYLKAAAEASAAMAVRADWPDAFIAMGNALVSFAHREPLAANRSTRLGEAASKLRHALELEETAQAYTALGSCLLEWSRNVIVKAPSVESIRARRIQLVEQAVESFQAAVKAEPGRPEPLIRLADARRRLATLGQGSSVSPRSLYEGALKFHPNDSRALRGLGLVLLDAGELQPAIDQLSVAVQANPDDANAAASLATAFCRLAIQSRNSDYLDNASTLVDQERLGKRNYAHRLILRADILQHRARLTKSTQSSADATVANLREALQYRQAAWPAARLIRATLELFNLTDDQHLLRGIAEPVRAAIATEPDNDDAQSALGSFNRFLDGPNAEAPPEITEIEKAVADRNYDYNW